MEYLAPRMTKELEWLALIVFVITIAFFSLQIPSLAVGMVLMACGILLVIAPSMYGDFPLPHSHRETLTGAALTGIFFVINECGAIASSQKDIPTALTVQWTITGVIGLALAGMALHIPSRKPKRFTESGCAYFRAMFLNGAWFFAWFLLQGSTPAFSIRWLCPALIDFPIVLTLLVYLTRRVMDRFKYPVRRDDEDVISVEARKELRLRKRRNVIYVCRSYVGEITIAGCLAVFFWAVFFRTPHFDPAQAANNVVGGFMLLLTLRYIRRANRRADGLLERDLNEIESRRNAAAANAVFAGKQM